MKTAGLKKTMYLHQFV